MFIITFVQISTTANVEFARIYICDAVYAFQFLLRSVIMVAVPGGFKGSTKLASVSGKVDSNPYSYRAKSRLLETDFFNTQ